MPVGTFSRTSDEESRREAIFFFVVGEAINSGFTHRSKYSARSKNRAQFKTTAHAHYAAHGHHWGECAATPPAASAGLPEIPVVRPPILQESACQKCCLMPRSALPGPVA